MGTIRVIGLDLAKAVFQVHAADEAGRVVLRRKLRRGQVMAFFAELDRCLIGLEACATAHLRYCVVKAFIGLLTPSLLPRESIDSTV
jgi:hypothetical protein